LFGFNRKKFNRKGRKDLRKGRKEKTSMTLNALNGFKNLTARDARIYAKNATVQQTTLNL
jgi:hypothetical protein